MRYFWVLFQQLEHMILCYGTHGSRQQINNISVQEEYKIWVLVAETYGYVVQLRPCQGAKNGKQVASSTKWLLGENFDLRLMECLTLTLIFDILMVNYFTSILLLTHFGVNNIRGTGYSTKIGHANALKLGTNRCQRRKLPTLNSQHQAKKECNFD